MRMWANWLRERGSCHGDCQQFTTIRTYSKSRYCTSILQDNPSSSCIFQLIMLGVKDQVDTVGILKNQAISLSAYNEDVLHHLLFSLSQPLIFDSPT